MTSVETNNLIMPRTQMTDDQILKDLKNTFGTEFVAADVRGYCASKNISYQTVTKRLEQFKIGRGKWNLEVTQQKVEEIERTFQAPVLRRAAAGAGRQSAGEAATAADPRRTDAGPRRHQPLPRAVFPRAARPPTAHHGGDGEPSAGRVPAAVPAAHPERLR